jgi:UDP-N-acetylglucosamine diphosphorylase / glucose-1-phosphate thymidylyltransferase / UDP-N-acetylgalactosamine diphosphorylase / glucosamine-1-phosphate N-acetyltransferase / galactosamine-1-phosphate N-acetyltransferase
MHVVIFEGIRWHTFAPVALSRPVFTLATGMSTLLAKQIRHLRPDRLTLWVRPELEEHCRQRIVPTTGVPTAVNQPLDGDEPTLLVSGRTVHFGQYEWPPHEAVMADEDGIVQSAFVRDPGLAPRDAWDRTDRWLKLLDLPRMMPQARMVDSLWDLIYWNEESLVEDAARLVDTRPTKPAGPYHMVNDDEVCIDPTAKIEPGCVLDAAKGPVVIADHARVGANAVLQGPCYVGPYAQVVPLALVRGGTTIGTMCKVGGEVAESILLGYSNKSHDGYLGHSYLGKWVNLGAGTSTSNLKNTYGEINVQIGQHVYPTGRRFLGALVGDHTKTAVHTRLGTGSYVGFCCQLAGSGQSPRFVKSFTYWTDKGTEPYRMDKAIEVTRRVFARRDRAFTELDERMMRYVAEVAAPAVEA